MTGTQGFIDTLTELHDEKVARLKEIEDLRAERDAALVQAEAAEERARIMRMTCRVNEADNADQLDRRRTAESRLARAERDTARFVQASLEARVKELESYAQGMAQGSDASRARVERWHTAADAAIGFVAVKEGKTTSENERVAMGAAQKAGT